MEIIKELKNDDKEEEKINLKQIIQVLKDIKLFKETNPDILLAVNKNYKIIQLSKEEDFKFDMQLTFKNNVWIVTSHNLPNRIDLLEIGKPTTLKRAVECCEKAIENLEEFYELIEELDSNFEIVQPRIKSSKDNWRIIKFNNNHYVKIELQNPMNTKDISVYFYGKNEEVQKMTDIYNNQQQEESVSVKIHYLKYELEGSDSSEKGDCGICLEFYDDLDQCPLIFCDNPACPQAFHSSCVSRHLKVSNLRILNVAVGECPYCKFKIQVNFTKDQKE